MTPALSDPLVMALARMVRSAIENNQRLVKWAVETETVLVEPCRCRLIIGEQGCVCNVEVQVPRAYMIRAKAHLARNETVGIPPRRKCLLCLAGEHDLDRTFLMTTVGPDGQELGRSRTTMHARRSKKANQMRADRARALPAGTAEQQRLAAGIAGSGVAARAVAALQRRR